MKNKIHDINSLYPQIIGEEVVEPVLYFDTGDVSEESYVKQDVELTEKVCKIYPSSLYGKYANEYAPVKGVGDKAREKRRKQYAEQIQRGVERGE